MALTACSVGSTDPGLGGGLPPGQSPSASSSATTASAASISANVRPRATVAVSKVLTLTAKDGTLDSVAVTAGARRTPVKGAISSDGTTWKATQRLEPGLKYRLTAVASDANGLKVTRRQTFHAQALTLDQQTFPSIAPLAGQVVGVGMPLIVKFDVPVTNRASIERHLHVVTRPAQVGSWHWISSTEVHWRPKDYWRAGTTVTVNADINSVPAGNGIYGQLSRSVRFKIGAAVISKVNVLAHNMKVYRNGTLLRTVPVTSGMPGFVTRSGIKVIIQKYRHIDMKSSTIGISDPNSPNFYDIPVDYALRVTYSGEFVHAAPWSEASQGLENVSHGCVGMSTSNAIWFYDLSKVGDVVKVTGSDRHMTLTNGYGDWTESFAQYKKGSALYKAHTAG